MTNTMKLKNKKGFTLTELIVVIVIIGILAAVLIPSLTGYIEKANKSAAEQEAAEVAQFYEMYLIEKEQTGFTYTAFSGNDGYLKAQDEKLSAKVYAETTNGFKYCNTKYDVEYNHTEKSYTTNKHITAHTGS